MPDATSLHRVPQCRLLTPFYRGKVIGVGVLIYVFVDQKNLNCTLVIDPPFQTFAVGLLVEFI